MHSVRARSKERTYLPIAGNLVVCWCHRCFFDMAVEVPMGPRKVGGGSGGGRGGGGE